MYKELPQLKKNKLKAQGFSLIEVLVSLAIFAIVVTVSVGSLMVLLETNARTRGVHAAMTNLSFMLDNMTRDIRTGSYYVCGSSATDLYPSNSSKYQDCSGGVPTSYFSFIESGDSLTAGAGSNRIAFQLVNGVIQRRLGTGSWIAVTDSNVTISELNFYVSDSAPLSAATPNKYTPRVTIFISGYMNTRGSSETFHIQTTVAQKMIDI